MRRVPSFWRIVDDRIPTDGSAGDSSPASAEKIHLWRLICAALRIPFKQTNSGLQVPVMFEEAARRHFQAVAAEGNRPAPSPLPVRQNIPVALGLMALLFLWFGITRQWWVAWPLIPVTEWNRLGALDVWEVARGEWYRVFTALTLHGDGGHLFNNLLFGTPFFVLLCRRVGTGPAALLAVLSGGLGNLGNTLYRHLSHSPAHVSLGFSTALFGIVGALTGLMATSELIHALRQYRTTSGLAPRLGPGLRRAFVFLAVGVAVLAMLGSDPSAKTDYAAHVFGLIGGLLCGSAYRLTQSRFSPFLEPFLGFLAAFILIYSWFFAF